MKKFSHSAHETLTELNITPLLDLCFVLLVIFIITTAPVVNDLEMELPTAAKREREPKPKVNYVTVDRDGRMFLNRQETDAASLVEELIQLRIADADLNVVVRGDRHAKHKHIVAALEALQDANIGKVNLATEPKLAGAPQ